MSPGNSADSTTNSNAANSDATNSNVINSNASNGTPKSSVSDRVSRATIEAVVSMSTPIPASVTTLQTSTAPTLVIDPSEGPHVAGTKVVAASTPSVLNHLWPESILAGLALGVTAYGAVVVARKRSERSIADADLEMLLITAQSDDLAVAELSDSEKASV